MIFLKIDAMKLCLIVISILIGVNKAKTQMKFKLLPTQECIKYIESHGINFLDYDSSLSIESGYGLIYRLPNKEIVLIPSNISMPYVGFIYQNIKAFDEMNNSGFFPIGSKYLSFLETERVNLNKLPESIPVYRDILKNEFREVSLPLNVESMEKLYFLIVKYIRRETDVNNKKRVLLSYAIMVMNYMVIEKGAKWNFEKEYEIYNSYSYPTVIINDELVDIVNILYSSLEDKGNYQLFKDLAHLHN